MLSCLCDHWQLLLTMFILQGFLGVLLFEWAWKKMERVRPDSSEEALAAELPSFRRPDAHLWKRAKLPQDTSSGKSSNKSKPPHFKPAYSTS